MNFSVRLLAVSCAHAVTRSDILKMIPLYLSNILDHEVKPLLYFFFSNPVATHGPSASIYEINEKVFKLHTTNNDLKLYITYHCDFNLSYVQFYVDENLEILRRVKSSKFRSLIVALFVCFCCKAGDLS